ncbi:MAG: RidA family protein [Bilophila sp.]
MYVFIFPVRSAWTPPRASSSADVKEQAAQALANMKAILAEDRSHAADVQQSDCLYC